MLGIMSVDTAVDTFFHWPLPKKAAYDGVSPGV